MKIKCSRCGKNIVPKKIKYKYYSIAVCPECSQELDLMSSGKYKILNFFVFFIMLTIYKIIISYFGNFDTKFKFFLFCAILALVIGKLYWSIFNFIVYKIKLF